MTAEIAGTLLLNPAVIDDPYPFYGLLRARAPVWKIPGTDLYTVSTLGLTAEAAGRPADFSSNITCFLYRDAAGLPARATFGQDGVQVLATADPPLHPLHRGTVFPELVATRMAALEPDVAGLASRCVTRVLDSGTADFMTALGNVVPITMISRLIGFRDADIGQLLSTALGTTALLGAALSHDELTQLVSHLAPVQAWLADQLTVAMNDPASDILGAVARGVHDGVFSHFEASTILLTLLSAGGETTASLLGNAVRLLAEDPDLQELLRQNPGQIPRFVEEALRLESPFRYQMRSVPKDTALGGVDIPAGATVLLLFGAANRDTAEYARPDEVDMQRQVPRLHLAFGRGIHHCVGAPLARLEAKVVLSVLLERTASISLDPDHAPRWASSLLVRRHEQLPVRLVSR